jgi:hypothetical protein
MSTGKYLGLEEARKSGMFTGPTTSACGIPCRGYQALDSQAIPNPACVHMPNASAPRNKDGRALSARYRIKNLVCWPVRIFRNGSRLARTRATGRRFRASLRLRQPLG